MVHPTSAAPADKSWLLPATLVALVYPIVGVTFSLPADASSAWRLAAWLASAVAFAMHLGYEHFRQRSPPVRGAFHVSAAVAAGSVLLAVWMIGRSLSANVHLNRLAPLALVIFPAVSGVPAFVVGLGVLKVLRRRQPHE